VFVSQGAVKMTCNELVYALVNELTVEQNIKFASSCINRVKHFLKIFVNKAPFIIAYFKEAIPENNIENKLREILDRIFIEPFNIENDEIDKDIEFLEKLLVDDDEVDSSTEKQLFFYSVIIIIHILEYIKEKDEKYIDLCSDAMVEIINQVKSAEYWTKHPECSDDELYEYVDKMIKDEVKRETEIIEMIKIGNEKTLKNCIDSSAIEYNV
jgi:hypothetical protein